jgi:hypothetical protein
MREVLADPIRKDGTDALQRLCVEDPQTGRQAVFPSRTRGDVVLAVFCSGPQHRHFAALPGARHGMFAVQAHRSRCKSTLSVFVAQAHVAQAQCLRRAPD